MTFSFKPFRGANDPKRPWSVRAYLLVVVALAGSLLAVFVWISSARTSESTRAEALKRVDSEAEFIAKDLATSIEAAQATVYRTATRGHLAQTLSNSREGCRLTGNALGAFSAEDVHLLLPDGEVLCSSVTSASGISYGDAKWHRELGRSKYAIVTPPFESPVSSENVVAVAMPVVGRKGHVAGAFMVVFHLKELASDLKATSRSRRSLAIILIDRQAREFLSSSEVPAKTGTSVTGTPFESPTDSSAVGLDGTRRLYGSAPLTDLGWRVEVGTDEASALASARADLRQSIISAGIILVLLMLLVIIINRRITRPLEALSKAIGAAGKEHTPAEISVTGPAEIVHLSDEFNSMIQTRADYEHGFLQTQKLEAVGQLAGGIAHDFNNLLTVILSYGHLLADDLKGDPRGEDLKEIVKAADRGALLTRRLLTFSRREPTSPKVLDMREAVEESMKLLRQLIREDIALTHELDPVCWRVVMDPVEFEQILMNLVVNARDAMPAGGTITISGTNRLIDGSESPDLEGGDYFALSVSDTGEGMDEATKERIFEAFFTTKSKDKGTGLGLSVVSELVRGAGGTIQVSSESGRGSTFTILLPRASGVLDSEVERVSLEVKDGSGRTILVVEDEERVRESTVRILQRYGYNVVATQSGAEALKLLAEGLQADLLLTDLIMPGMQGIDVARRAGLPVLFLSGYADGANGSRGGMVAKEADGSNDVKISISGNLILKPFVPRVLLRAIEKRLAAVPVKERSGS